MKSFTLSDIAKNGVKSVEVEVSDPTLVEKLQKLYVEMEEMSEASKNREHKAWIKSSETIAR